MNAETIRFEADEAGWEMVVESDWGTFRFNIHGCVLDLDHAYQRTIAAYLAEGQAAAASYHPPITQDDLNGYDLNDPKRYALEQEMR